MKNMCLILIIIVVSMIDFFFMLPAFVAHSQQPTLVNPQLQTPSEPEQVLWLNVFVDRTVVQEEENFEVKVWIQSRMVKSGTVTVFFAKDRLQLKGKESVSFSLPMTSPITLAFMGKSGGKSNMFIYVSGINPVTKESITVTHQIDEIEVKAKAPLWSRWSSGPLSGVFVGALLSFVGTFFYEQRQHHKKLNQYKGWITFTLPKKITDACNAIDMGRETKLDSWLDDKLLIKEYSGELQQLAKKYPNLKNLLSKLLGTSRRLQEYEKLRKTNELTQGLKDDLIAKLDEIIEGLSRL